MKIQLSRDWTEFLSALISRRVRFVLVGGHAVAGHGEPRLTEDLDVFVERSPANAKKLREAAESARAESFRRVLGRSSSRFTPAVARRARHLPGRADVS